MIRKLLIIYFLIFSSINAEKRLYPFEPQQMAKLLEIVAKLQEGKNIIYTKYGDGEYNCMIGMKGYNIDHDSYHDWLGQALKKALISLSQKPNTYIGKWWSLDVTGFCDKLASENHVNIPWSWYHLVMNDDDFYKFNYMYKFVEFIINTKRKKILICNNINSRLKSFFRVDQYIEIPQKNWSFDYNNWKNKVEQCIEKDAIILISAGMCSKILIDDITNSYQVSCIDLGSSFDFLASKVNTRGWRHSYATEVRYYNKLLPKNWK